MRLLQPLGTALWFGMHDQDSPIPAFDLVVREQRILGSFAYTNPEFARAVELLASGQIRPLVSSSIVPLEESAAAFEALVAGRPASSPEVDRRPRGPPRRDAMALTHLTIQQAVADAVRTRVISGQLPAGTRIDQDALAAEFSVSRMPVREALRQLGAEGFVTIVPHRGAIVTALSPAEVEEIYEIRAALEGVAARHASQALTRGRPRPPAEGPRRDAKREADRHAGWR